MLADYLTWHLRAALAPLTYTDDQPRGRGNPIALARRSARADAKAATHTTPDGHPVRSFRSLLDHLAALTRSTIAIGTVTFGKLGDPTPTQRRAFDLIGTPIPLTLGSAGSGPVTASGTDQTVRDDPAVATRERVRDELELY